MGEPRTRVFFLLRAALLVVCAFALSCADDRETAAVDEDAAQNAIDAPAATDSGSSNDVRNLILISLDTLRPDHLGLYGYSRATSPNLDRFAEGAVVFEGATAQASSTRPSHQSLFLSKPPSTAALGGLALAEVLAEQGFRTAAYTGGGNISSQLGFARGFEVYEENSTGLASELTKASAWLRAHRDERFFLFLHTYDIHLPYDPPEPHYSMFAQPYDGPVRGDNSRPILRREAELNKEVSELDANDREHVIALYDGGIHYTDAQLAHLLALVEELKLEDDTAIVFFSDHGEEFWEHGSVIHSRTLFQELIHVPLLIRAPGLAPARISTIVPMMDLSPTLLELLGIAPPAQFEGRTLTPLIAGQEAQSQHRTVASEQRALKSILEFPWKLVRDEDGGEALLFNLVSDPGEENNLAATQPEVLARLNKQLSDRFEGHLGTAVPEVQPGIEDPELLERLRALGYIE
ncbi:MAG: arylsulfatase A-like enzyme [Myxococcota bacterium]|jgi:arylsulfatase A-like enzyme